MLAKSSKSRVAAIAIMALGVSTFMGTSAALATGVNVSGTVGTCAVASTVSASAVTFGTVKRADTGSGSLTTTIVQGKKDDCTGRSSDVTATIADADLSGEAATGVAEGNRVKFTIGNLADDTFPMTAAVPNTAAIGNFGATVTLTLSDNN
jgi:hypothetical protein